VLLLFNCEKCTKPTPARLFLQTVFELHLRVEFTSYYTTAKLQFLTNNVNLKIS